MHICIETGSIFLERFWVSSQERHKGSICVRRGGSREKFIELVCQALGDNCFFQVKFTGTPVLGCQKSWDSKKSISPQLSEDLENLISFLMTLHSNTI